MASPPWTPSSQRTTANEAPGPFRRATRRWCHRQRPNRIPHRQRQKRLRRTSRGMGDGVGRHRLRRGKPVRMPNSRRDAPGCGNRMPICVGGGRTGRARLDICRRGAGQPPAGRWIRLGSTRDGCGSSASSIEPPPSKALEQAGYQVRLVVCWELADRWSRSVRLSGGSCERWSGNLLRGHRHRTQTFLFSAFASSYATHS